MQAVTEMTLPFTRELVRLGGLSYDATWLTGYDSDYETKAVILSVIVELVSFCAIVYNAVSVSQDKSGSSRLLGTLSGASNAVFALILPRLVLPTLLSTFCGTCPAAGKFSIGFVLLLTFAVLDSFVRFMLTSIDGDVAAPPPASSDAPKAE